jgi:hypothetical protein
MRTGDNGGRLVMDERRKRIHKVGEDLFVAPSSPQSLLIYREGMLPLRVKLSEVEPLIKALKAVIGDLALGTVPPDPIVPRLDD